jgi:hypothetical protein
MSFTHVPLFAFSMLLLLTLVLVLWVGAIGNEVTNFPTPKAWLVGPPCDLASSLVVVEVSILLHHFLESLDEQGHVMIIITITILSFFFDDVLSTIAFPLAFWLAL